MKAMYKLILLPVVLIVFLGEAYANDYNVVFDITSSDKKDWQSLLNNLENVKKSVGSASQLEVVVHGGALGILLKKTGFQVERMRKIAASGVEFLACENTMKRKGAKKSDLRGFAGTVPAGLVEIIDKQAKGWAYLKIGK